MVIAALVIGQGDPGDAGIDGIISLDKLGLGKFYVQAKRWRIMRWALHHNCCDCLHWIVITLTRCETAFSGEQANLTSHLRIRRMAQ